MNQTPKAMNRRFRQIFWLPPRPHGEVIEDRTVSFLELFYDLVYVVVIARAAHHLAEHLTWRGVGEFVVIFGLIWIAWLNGTLYHDLHGRNDSRSRTFIFAQMLILALLGTYTSHAADDTGRQFALTYVAFLAVLTWLWYSVRRVDAEEYRSVTTPYIAGMIVSIIVIGASALVPDAARVWVWAAFLTSWMVGNVVLSKRMIRSTGQSDVARSESLIERFGLFTIIVLGEVIVGVVTGMSEAETTPRAIVTGLLGLMVGFGIWWTYFDFIGRRAPESDTGMVGWMMGHLPVTMAIAGSGAALVGLVEHADDDRALVGAAWVLSGSVALALLGMILVMASLRDFDRFPSIYRPVTGAMLAASVVALALAWWSPAPWLLVLGLLILLSFVWWLGVDRWLRLPDPAAALP